MPVPSPHSLNVSINLNCTFALERFLYLQVQSRLNFFLILDFHDISRTLGLPLQTNFLARHIFLMGHIDTMNLYRMDQLHLLEDSTLRTTKKARPISNFFPSVIVIYCVITGMTGIVHKNHRLSIYFQVIWRISIFRSYVFEVSEYLTYRGIFIPLIFI